MMTFYEKPDENILDECVNFINANSEPEGEYETYRKALHLYSKLSKSLIDSHKKFEEAIKCESSKVIFAEDENEMCFSIYEFKQKKISLVLDTRAQEVLCKLSKIKSECMKKISTTKN